MSLDCPAAAAASPSAALWRRWRAVRRSVLRRRRLLAAVLVATAVLAGLQAAGGTEPNTVAVVVTARPVPAGATLSEADLVTAHLPADAAPLERLPMTDLVGATVAAPLGEREPVTTSRLLGDGAWSADVGEVAVPVRLPDPGVVELLGVGDLVDLVATDPTTGDTRTVARGVRVAAVSVAESESGLSGRLIVVVAAVSDAPDIASAAVLDFLSVTLSR